MRWWLGLAFAAVAGFTAVAVVTVFNTRAEHAFRTHEQEFALGNAIAASETLRKSSTPAELRADAASIATRRGLALFVFDARGRLLTAGTSEGVAWANVPNGERAARISLTSGRYIEGRSDGSAFVIGVRVYSGPAAVVVAYSRRPELRDELGVVRHEFVQSALLAFAVGAGLGLLIATLIARRLARIARAAHAIGSGDFSVTTSGRFPDEVGSLTLSIERMRVRLQQLFERVEGERDRLESLLDRLDEGVLLVRSDLGIEYANGRARELLGVDGGLADADAGGALERLVRSLFAAERARPVRVERGERVLLVSGIPPAADGDAAILVVLDESERERNERVQREFATNAAHELRTPLASIVTAVEMLRTGAKDDPEALDEFLDMIARESDRLTRLTRALLVLARAEAHEEQPRLTPVELAPLLEQVAAALPRRNGVEVGVDCPPALEIAGDADLLEQALTSLAANAVRYTAAGSVTMRGRRQNGSVVIEVADTGSGIPRRELGRIFDRFYRAGDREDGFGLGLAIAREAVRSLGGEIELESEQAVGTTVRITLAPAGDGAEVPA
jgi:two-component system sensor histidine kinase VicK